MSSPLHKPVVEAPNVTTTREVGHAQAFDLHPTPSKDAHIAAGPPRQEEPLVSINEGMSTLSLPQVDGGRQAWAYLLCATILETLVWG